MSDLYQAIGNGCAGMAALLFAVPLQHLLREIGRKKEDGGGILAGFLILLPMWLLLAIALMFVIAEGGFDWLGLNRIAVCLLFFAATMIMAATSFFFVFEPLRRLRWMPFISALPIYVFPLLTILLVFFSLNPSWSIGAPLVVVNRTWAALAAIHLAVGGVLATGRSVRYVRSHTLRFVGSFGRNRELEKKNLAVIVELDPQRGFSELMRMISGNSNVVRVAAMTQMRRHPEFIAALAEALQKGWSEPALDALECATLTAEELKLLVAPARAAIKRLTRETHDRFRYVRKSWLKTAVRKGRGKQINALTEKFNGIGVDFSPLGDEFEASFDNPDY